MVPVLYQDPFSPVLLSSPALNVTDEQKLYVRKVLDKSSSDTRFAQKAYDALVKILTGGSVVSPVVTSLVPSTVVLGSPSFTLHVRGTGFTSGSKIIFNGSEEVTTFVSAQDITTGVDMSTASTPITVPVQVLSEDGVLSNVMNFEFLPSVVRTSPGFTSVTPSKEEYESKTKEVKEKK